MRKADILLLLIALGGIGLGGYIGWQQVFGSVENQQKLLIPLGLLVLFFVGSYLQKNRQRCHSPRHAHAPAGSKQSVVNRHQTGQGMAMSELNRYFAWIEKKMHELMVREGLECGLVKMRRGPLVITMQLRLINPTQRDLQKLLKLGPALAQILQVESVRLADTAHGIQIELPSPKPTTPNGSLLARHGRRLQIPIGVSAAARPVLVNLEDHGALFWVGPSRRGKTQSMKSVLYTLLKNGAGRIHFIIIASPAKVNKDWGVFKTVYGCLGIISDKDEISDATAWVVQQMYSGTHLEQDIHLVLVVDDLPNILKVVPAITGDLAEIAGMGAGLGIHLLVGTQGAGSKQSSGGTQIENNVTARVLYRPSTTRTGSQNAGVAGLSLSHLTANKGDAIALIDGQSTRIATAWILDRDISLLNQQQSVLAPWKQAHNQDQSSNDSTKATPPNRHAEQAEQPWSNARTAQNNRNSPIEQPETTQNNARTGQNNPEQGRTTFTRSEFTANGYQNGHASKSYPEQPAEHVSEQLSEKPPEQPTYEPNAQPIDALLHELADCSIDELKNFNLGLDASHDPTPDEQRVIQMAYGLTASIRKTCFMVYGHYNGKVQKLVKRVTDGTATNGSPSAEQNVSPPSREPLHPDEIPEHIDLTTTAGRSTLEQLQKNGVINWPDVDDLITEES